MPITCSATIRVTSNLATALQATQAVTLVSGVNQEHGSAYNQKSCKATAAGGASCYHPEVMQEQGRSLAEQAQHSERRQTQLMHELQVQHQQQMDKMSQEYEHRWHSLKAVQVETSEAVAALEGNMADMKSVMQGHIDEAEVKLGQLQSRQ